MPAQQDVLFSTARSAFDLVAGTTSTRLALVHLASLIGVERLPRELRPAAPEPIPFRDVERLLKRAWGRPPAKALGDLEPDPVAVTGAAQVHRGEDEDGRAVAVKVRRPGLAEVVRSDLILVETAAGAFSSLFPRVDMGAVLRELRERLMDELDLEYEAATQRRFARALRRHERLHVPMPVTDLCEEDVLVGEWVDGVPLRALENPDDRAAAAGRLLEFAVTAPQLVGVAVADPHHDDALLMADGRLALLDFGAVREVEPARAELARRALEAFRAGDAEGLATVVDEAGWLAGCTAADARLGLDIAEDLLGPVLRGEAPLDAGALEDALARAEPHLEAILAVARRGSAVPADLWPLRGAGQLGLVLAGLGVQADWLALAAGWMAPPAA